MSEPLDYMGLMREFHRTFRHPIADKPHVPEDALRMLRLRLLTEEFREYHEEETEVMSPSLPKIAKELADDLVIAFGTAVAYGIPMDEVFKAVHESNMSKLGDDGTPIKRPDGKVLKGPNYKAPDVEGILRRHL